MRMVGATNHFIRSPFIVEGLVLGEIAALVAFGLEWLLYDYIAEGVVGSTGLMEMVAFPQFALPLLLLMLAAGALLQLDVKNGWKIFRRDRCKHASPNSAQTESVCAGLLGLRLAGNAWYHGVLHKKDYIGDAKREIELEDIPRAGRLMYLTAVLALVVFGAGKALLIVL